ncbi:class I SAM-dependent methyltransferase [Paenibacillus contaminans]|uniref:Class I SAM-dependent methyltransferase n=1 Tax=Paenibacillus contaminans TaxID=450362 RepID=A0A329MUB1_9BACL|nr:class I SAM-dependent methyltransferase [Paenibacillus contaminans]RAV22928.1 hypothetical protein DQG23_01620 [Paenibacillus contaminans]
MLVRDIEKALLHAERHGFGFGAMSLSKSALVHLARKLDPPGDGSPIRILELGGGQSTIFWSSLEKMSLLPVRVTTLEHDPAWARELQARITNESIDVSLQTLKQISGSDWERMFADSDKAGLMWEEIGESVPSEQFNHFTIENAFYAEAHSLILEPESIDAMIVDGPHGNGRSLAFLLFAAALKPGALVLIDDFDHYPFLADFGRVFRYEELYREIIGDKRWVLAQCTGRR